MWPPSPALTPVLMVIFMVVSPGPCPLPMEPYGSTAGGDHGAAVAGLDAGLDDDSLHLDLSFRRTQQPGPTIWVPALTFVLMVIFFMVVSP
jgi:hypothetical protein